MGQKQSMKRLDSHIQILLHLLQIQKKQCKGVKTVKFFQEMNNLINDLEGYQIIECTVKKELKDLNLQKLRGGLRIGNESLREIFNPLTKLSSNDYGVTVSTGFKGSNPFATMKILTASKDVFQSDYSLHEIIIGLILNSIRKDTPCFTYCYGGFYCTPPMDMERYWKTVENNKYYELYSKFKTGDEDLDEEISKIFRKLLQGEMSLDNFLIGYQNLSELCREKIKDLDLSNLEKEIEEAKYSYPVISSEKLCRSDKKDDITALSLFEFVRDSKDFIEFLNDYEILEKDKINVFQMIYISLYIAYKKFHYIHGGNIIVQNLGKIQEISLYINDKIITFHTQYIPKIIDYGSSLAKFNGEVINSSERGMEITDDLFYKELQKFIDNVRLFSNFDIILPKLEIINSWKYKYLKGPISISEHYSPKFRKHIYIFGDQHDKKNTKCLNDSNEVNTINIAELLSELPGLNDSKTLDYFIETVYLSNKIETVSSEKPELVNFIDDISEKFKNCNKIDKKMCEFKNLRYHYADIRVVPIIWNLILIQFLIHVITMVGNLQPEKPLINIDVVSNLFLQINWDLLMDNWSHFIEYSKSVSKIDKQIVNVENKEVLIILKELENEVKDNFNSIDKDLINKIKDTISNGGSFTSLKKEHNDMLLLRVQNKILLVGTKIFDLYLLGRMFRKWKNNVESTNIIVYVGDKHAQRYRKVLEKLGFKTLNESFSEKDNDYQCVNIEKFNQPFFSQM